MKQLAAFLFIAVVNPLFAGIEIPFKPFFEVLSDSADPKVSSGKCLIEGEIVDFYSGEKLSGVTIVRTQGAIRLQSADFSILMKLSKPAFTLKKKGYVDLVFDQFGLKGGHRLKVRFYMQQEGQEHHFEVKKPVIYCYSEKDLEFDLGIRPRGKLSFSYPELTPGEKWEMQLRSGQLSDRKTGLAYPYLFWESLQENVSYKKTGNGAYAGDIVSREQLLSYLERSLTAAGFNERERTDFITFWGPQMNKHPFCLVQFLHDDECGQFADYEISPKPDHLNRFYMLFSGFETYPGFIKTEIQQMQSLVREGFYLVDWGGIELPFAEDL